MRGAGMGGGLVASGAIVSALAITGAPWWAIAAVASVLTTAGAVVALTQIFIPQESPDRLAWWRDRRAHQERRRRTMPARSGRRAPDADNGSRRATRAGNL
ncbi:hypothetical protein [Actinoplanes subglobosus]|uniref:Uncharacterized protein n=1 Tax=Actinoplanes subglobosus TaxID=1547892 RepID=A0ABV8IRC0_9ACTN